MKTILDLTADIIDVRDIIERFEELKSERDNLVYDYSEAHDNPSQNHKQAEKDINNWDDENAEEFRTLGRILEELKGNGGDEQWEGDWYPITLIRDHHFTDYCRELCEDIGAVPRDLPAYIAIDWDETARNIMVDYSSVEVVSDNRWVTYFYR